MKHREQAVAIADWAERQQLTNGRVDEDGETIPSLREALDALQAHATTAQAERNGRELAVFERHPQKIERLVVELIAGNYRDVAARLAGISDRAVRHWMEQADKGDPRYAAVADVIQIAEAYAESTAVRNVRAAGKDPRFWAADMTYLERRHPERWGRRQEDSSVPRVIVQIGVSADSVRLSSAVQETDERKTVIGATTGT